MWLRDARELGEEAGWLCSQESAIGYEAECGVTIENDDKTDWLHLNRIARKVGAMDGIGFLKHRR